MTSDATGRHDRATGDAPNGTPEGDTNATGARVLSITAAAQVLGLSVRTVQRRLDAGTLQAVEVEGARRVRLPDDATSNATDRATGGTPQGDTVTRQHATGDATEGDSLGDTRQAQVLAAPSREEELREEIRFLRGVVEQQQRDSAELRAALRAALQMSQRALPASTSTVAQPEQFGQVRTEKLGDVGRESGAALQAQEAPRNVATGAEVEGGASGPQRAAEGAPRASTWDRSRGFRGWLLRMLRG